MPTLDRRAFLELTLGLLAGCASTRQAPTGTTRTAPNQPGRPVLGFYGGIGLRPVGDRRWSPYNIDRPADVDYLMGRCEESGINRISAALLEQTPASAVLGTEPSATSDLIDYAIDAAHSRGIEVYGDLAVFGVSALDRPFLDRHPQVLTRDRAGVPTPYMMSPAYPEVRAYRRALILEWLARYPLDGVHLDYIRWPYYGQDLIDGICEHGYDPPLLATLRQLHDLAPSFLPDAQDQRLIALRCDLVTDFIRELRADMARAGRSVPIAVYNSNAYGREPSRRTVGQAWEDWAGLVDEHHPMFLFDSPGRLARAIDSLVAVADPRAAVIGPLFLAEGFCRERSFVPTAARCVETSRLLLERGCNGVWLCRSNEVEEYELWPAVRRIGDILSRAQPRAATVDRLNLVANGSFERGLEDWTCTPSGAVLPDPGAGVRIRPRADAPVVLRSQPIALTCQPAYAARALGLEVVGNPAPAVSPRPARAILTVTSADGLVSIHPVELATTTTRAVFEFPSPRTPVEVDLRVEVRPGRGETRLRRVRLTTDPGIDYRDSPTTRRRPVPFDDRRP